MPGEDHKELLVRTMQGAVTSPTALQVLLEKVQPGASGDLPSGASHNDAIEVAVRNADGQGWLRELVEQLIKDYPRRPEFNEVLKEIAEAEKADGEKKVGLLRKMGLRDPKSQIGRLRDSLTDALVSLAGFFLSLRFLAGLAVCLLLVLASLSLVPDDEIAIKPLVEGGGRARFVNLQYESKAAVARGRAGEPLLLSAPDDDGFYRIQHRDIAEPPQIDLVLDEAKLPPQWTGNNKKTVLQVVKVNYEEIGLPLWNKSRKLFLYVKLQSFKTEGDTQ